MEQLSIHNQDSLNDFYNQIATLKKQEEERGTAYFDELNPSDLGEDDKNLYDKFLNDSLTIEELKDRYNRMMKANVKNSSGYFLAYISNMVQAKQLQVRKNMQKNKDLLH